MISSLNFKLPDISKIGSEYYEYNELRLQSIIFSVRFIFPILLNWIESDSKLNRLFIFYIFHGISDLIFESYKGINGTAVRGTGNKYSLKIQLSHRFASISQFASIVSLLDITGNNPKTILNNDYI